ncbi:MAG: homoserine kinase [Acidobacteriota bacterium]|nr:homoserine kinase [Acidobacteriota bacterium]
MLKASVRVPASSANLGPGFDALGLALELYLECDFESTGELRIEVEGRDAACIPTGADNLIWQTALTIAARAGRELPPILLRIRNDIPLGKGLGSSAAALTAGVVIADRLLGFGWSRDRILDEAARLEGHPDNVAACVLGSIVASAIDSSGAARTVRLDWPANFGVAIVVPNFTLPTSKARAVLPECYPKADAIFNIQCATLLIAALATGTAAAFPAALDDRMHQSYRASLVPGLAEILKLRAPGLLGCALSGAGPSVLVFYERGSEDVCDLVRQIFAARDCCAEIFFTRVAASGYELKFDGADA